MQTENARPGSTGWTIARDGDPYRLAGYASRASVRPGEPVTLALSSSVRPVNVTAYRLGWYAGKRARVVWRAPHALRPGAQARPQLGAGREVRAGWRPTTTVSTRGWLPGSYVFLLTAGRERKWVPLTVASPDVRGKLVLVNATATYQAYNTWGGYSLYRSPNGSFATRASRVSYDRPYDERGADTFMKQELKPISYAEQLGLDLGYVSSTDLERNPRALDGARGVVFLGHDEYWSTAMRATVTRARDRGTNLAFLGGNNVYWRVRYERPGAGGEPRRLVGYKSGAADPVKGASTTDLWRRSPSASPEHTLVGMLYECYPAAGCLRVTRPGHPFFAGTGVKAGSVVPGLIGVEVDRAYPVRGTPSNLEVLSHSRVSCRAGHTYSDMTYYTTRSGAGVFAAGNMQFTRPLTGPDRAKGQTDATTRFVRVVVANILRRMAAGPMGKTHPSRGNLASLHASSSTSTGTGYAVDPGWLRR